MIRIIFLLLFLFASTFARQIEVNDICNGNAGCGLVLFHNYEGDTADKSGYSSDGTISGDGQILSETLETGDSNSYLNLSGGYLEINETFTVSPPEMLTVIAWFRASDLSGIYNLLVKADELAVCVGNTVIFRDNKGNGYDVSGLSLEPNRWHFFAGVYDPVSGNIRIYIDGKLIGEGIKGTFSPSSGNPGFTAGSGSVPNGACSGNDFRGDIDNLIILKRSLSTDEIRRIYSIDPRQYVYMCSDNGAVYSSNGDCNSACSASCALLVPTDKGTSGACDTANYEGFVYFNNKTYALSKNTGFWTDFNNLAIIPDQQTNNLLAGILSRRNIGDAWIGIYDPDQSKNYNTVDPSRFIWRDGSSPSYTNWRSDQPNNYLSDADIGVVPVYGEYWGEMYSDGTWNDGGYHAAFGGDYKPKFRALVEWSGPLDCVRGETPNDPSTIDDLINQYCDGQTPCFLCSDGSKVDQCGEGPYFGGSYDFVSENGSVPEVKFLFPLEGNVILSGEGVINYCAGTGECPASDNDALLSYIVFRGSDGNYYWFGNPNNSSIYRGTGFNPIVLSYNVDNSGGVSFTVPDGITLDAFSDYETVLGQSTSDNQVNFNLTVYRNSSDWLCPLTGNCVCPDGSTWNDDTKYCEKTPSYTCSSSYTLDTNDSVCVSSPVCSDGSYVDVRKRCEKPPSLSCPSNYSLDSQNEVCFSDPYCKEGFVWNMENKRCERPAILSCSVGTLNSSTLKCEYTPTCDVGTLELGKCIISPVNSCSLGTLDPADNRLEWNTGCNNGVYSSQNDRCEWTPSCPGTNGTYISESQICTAPISETCEPNFQLDLINDRCVGYDTVESNKTCEFGQYNPATNRCEYNAVVKCSLSKSSCINPSEVYSCLMEGQPNCSYTHSDGTVYQFDSNCSVNTPCGILSGGSSCSFNDGTSAVDCVFSNSNKTFECPYGDYVLDSTTGKCVSTNVIYSCPNGYDLVGSVCQKEIYSDIIRECKDKGYSIVKKSDGTYACEASPVCEGGYFDTNSGICYNTADCKGGNYDPVQDVCYSNTYFTCPEGFTLDTSSFEIYGEYRCVKDASCVFGGNLGSSGNCELFPESDCGNDFLDLSSQTCYTEGFCKSPGYYSNVTDRCETSVLKTCDLGTFDSNLDTCFFDPSCSGEGAFNSNLGRCELKPSASCDLPFNYNDTYDVCQTTQVCDGLTECNFLKSCPDGMTYSAVYGKCISDPVCSLSGFTYDVNSRKCIGDKIANYTCPSGYTRNGDFCEGPPITESISASGNNASNSVSLDLKTLLSTGTVSYDNVDERFYVCVNDKLIFYSHNSGDYKYTLADNVSCSYRPNTSNVYFYSNSGTSVDLGTNVDSPTIKVGTLNFNGPGSGSGEYYYKYCDGIGTYENGVCKVYPIPEYEFTDYVLRDGDWVGPEKYWNCSEYSDYNYFDDLLPRTYPNPNKLYEYKGACLTQDITVNPGDYIEIYKDVNYACDDDSAYFSYSVKLNGIEIDSGYYTCPNGTFTKKIGISSAGTLTVEMKYMNSLHYDWVNAGFKHYFPKYYCQYPSVEGSDGRCYLEPICNTGSLVSSVSGYCEEFQDVEVTCPLDPSLPCIDDGSGKLMCSPYRCGDVEKDFNLISTDTEEGANDKKADGVIDENGNCTGTVYIFNGQDRRCRPPGTQTVGNDCCKDDKIDLLGLVTLGKCNSDEVVLAGLRNSEDGLSQCHYVGKYCSEKLKWPGGSTCLQYKKTYCCFGSILSRIIQEQGRQQLGIDWGQPESPQCRGFTPEEFQNIDFGKIDFSEFENTVKRKAVENLNTDTLNNDFKAHINDVFNK